MERKKSLTAVVFVGSVMQSFDNEKEPRCSPCGF
jgi:hypothetical protein